MAAPDPADAALARLKRDLGLRRLNPVWAKLELVLGLGAAAGGLVAIVRGEDTPTVAAGAGLFALGFYLALAGHRSHLYQSNNRLAAYIVAHSRSGPPTAPGDRR